MCCDWILFSMYGSFFWKNSIPWDIWLSNIVMNGSRVDTMYTLT